MPSGERKSLTSAIGRIFLPIAATLFFAIYSQAASGTLTVSGTQWGVTSI